MFCKKCGQEVYDGRRFCKECGNELIGATNDSDISFFISNLSSKNGTMRQIAEDNLIYLGDLAFEPLLETLKKGGYYARLSATAILNRTGNSKIVSPLLELLDESTESKIKKRVLEILGNIRDEGARRVIYRYTHDENEYIQKSAKEALNNYHEFRSDGLYQGPYTISGDPRPIERDVSLSSIGGRMKGIRIFQIVFAPSFSQGYAWDIRRTKDDLRLYRSKVVFHNMQYMLKDYCQLDIASIKLDNYFNQLRKVSLSISPLYRDEELSTTGLDGEVYQLALFGEMHSSTRFIWWSHPPAQWNGLVAITNQMISEFLEAPELKEGSAERLPS